MAQAEPLLALWCLSLWCWYAPRHNWSWYPDLRRRHPDFRQRRLWWQLWRSLTPYLLWCLSLWGWGAPRHNWSWYPDLRRRHPDFRQRRLRWQLWRNLRLSPALGYHQFLRYRLQRSLCSDGEALVALREDGLVVAAKA